MPETLASISAWQKATFPDATAEGTLKHIEEEWEEFGLARTLADKSREAADLIITLTHWMGAVGLDPQQVLEAKMEINRNRQWNIQPDGTGRHK